jgi:hypothetical protein
MKVSYPICFGIVALAAAIVIAPLVHGGKNNQKCIPLEVVRAHGSTVGIQEIHNQFFVDGQSEGTLNTTDNCVQGLPPETVNALEQAQAQQAQQAERQ